MHVASHSHLIGMLPQGQAAGAGPWLYLLTATSPPNPHPPRHAWEWLLVGIVHE